MFFFEAIRCYQISESAKCQFDKCGLYFIFTFEPLISWCLRWLKASAYNAGDLGLIPGSGRSPGEGNGNPLQYPCLENPMDEGAW